MALAQDGDCAVLEPFHIMNNFDIPEARPREHEKDEHGNILANYIRIPRHELT
jgi:penicillin V acylase-like amidase (Ntn superfamily)